MLGSYQRNNKILKNMNLIVIQIAIGALGMVPKCLAKDEIISKSEEESWPSRQRHCLDRPEYWEESWRLEICCHSNFCVMSTVSSIWKTHNYWYTSICHLSTVLANEPGERGSIPDRVIPKTLKMVLDATLVNTKHYKVRIKSKLE